MVNIGHALRKEVTGRKLAFNLFFYGTHIGLFAFGWWVGAPFLPDLHKHWCSLIPTETSLRRAISSPQHSKVLSLDI